MGDVAQSLPIPACSVCGKAVKAKHVKQVESSAFYVNVTTTFYHIDTTAAMYCQQTLTELDPSKAKLKEREAYEAEYYAEEAERLERGQRLREAITPCDLTTAMIPDIQRLERAMREQPVILEGRAPRVWEDEV